MSELTLGVELEVRSRPIDVLVPNVLVPKDLGKPWVDDHAEPCFLYTLDGSYLYTHWNKRVVAKNDLVELTLEVSYHTGHRAKIEFRTPVDCTQSLRRFQDSTTETLFVMHVLYYFVANRSADTTLATFVDYYRGLCERLAPSSAHPPLKFADAESEAAQTATDLAALLTFPRRRGGAPVQPRFAPQLTFSAPLERIPALFSAPRSTFHEPPPLGSSHEARPLVTPQVLEGDAVVLARAFVEESFRGADRERFARKLKGFFTLLFHTILTAAFAGRIDRGDVRSPRRLTGGTPKDNFRFLLRSRLNTLYYQGLTENDRAPFRSQHPATMARNVLECCKQFLEVGRSTAFELLGNEQRQNLVLTRVSPQGFLRDPITRAFTQSRDDGDDSAYDHAFEAIVDEAARIDQIERGVKRKALPNAPRSNVRPLPSPPVSSLPRTTPPASSSSSSAPRAAPLPRTTPTASSSPSSAPPRAVPPPRPPRAVPPPRTTSPASSSSSSAPPRAGPPPPPPRWNDGYLYRPVLEYRRLIGDHDGYFTHASEAADAFRELYAKLRWLESNTNPVRTEPDRATGSKAYYRPVERLPWSSGQHAGLETLTLQNPEADPEIQRWWRTVNFLSERRATLPALALRSGPAGLRSSSPVGSGLPDHRPLYLGRCPEPTRPSPDLLPVIEPRWSPSPRVTKVVASTASTRRVF